MREIQVKEISTAIEKMCVEANLYLPEDIKSALDEFHHQETNPLAQDILSDLVTNYQMAEQNQIPVCQDTGMVVVFVELGQEVHLVGGLLEDAVNQGIADGYQKGLLRLSVISDPIERKNTNTNTPAVIHIKLVEGDQVKITLAPKGAGSENMSRLTMLNPSAGREDIINFVVETMTLAGSNPCPPVVIGVGIGGNFEYCAQMAKEALCRSIEQRNENSYYRQLEEDILQVVNELGIGPQGFGGKTTALAVNIVQGACHIASLPVAVNMGCHAMRHKSIIL